MEPTVQQLFDLSNKVALLTGGTGHLGGAMARALAEVGASVLLTSRQRERAETAVARLPRIGDARHFGLPLDHLNPTSIEESFSEALRLTGRVDIFVCNAHEMLTQDWTTVEAEAFNRHLANATGCFLLARHVRDDAVRRAAAATIILVGSMYGHVGSYPDAYDGISPASSVAYHVLKGGIVQMARHLAVYWARDRIRVNCLCPGPFPGPSAPAELVTRLKDKSPLGRMGEPWELKGAVVFLASDASSYLTGQSLVIDGGWTAW
jgi:gluconate 5-dehydrogenase